MGFRQPHTCYDKCCKHPSSSDHLYCCQHGNAIFTGQQERKNPVYDTEINNRVDKLWSRVDKIDIIYTEITNGLKERIKELEEVKKSISNSWWGGRIDERIKELEGYVKANTISTVIEYRERVSALEEKVKGFMMASDDHHARIKELEFWKDRLTSEAVVIAELQKQVKELLAWKKTNDDASEYLNKIRGEEKIISKKVWEDIKSIARANYTVALSYKNTLTEAIQKVDKDFCPND